MPSPDSDDTEAVYRKHRLQVIIETSMHRLELEHIAAVFGAQDSEKLVALIAGRPVQAALEAMRFGHAELAEWIMSTYGLHVNAQGRDGESFLHAAAYRGDCELISRLSQREGFTAYIRDTKRRTALHAACRGGQFAAARLLVEEYHLSPHAKDGFGATALVYASEAGSIELVRWLVTRHAADPDVWAQIGQPVAIAADGGHFPVVEWLMSVAGARPAARRGYPGLCAHAAASGNLPLLKWLAHSAGVDLRQVSLHGFGVIHFAAESGNLDMVRWLVEKERLQPFTTLFGITTLHIAAQSGSLPLVQWLVKEGFGDVTSVCDDEGLPLHRACVSGNLELVRWLLEQGDGMCDPLGKFDMTPLHIACDWGHDEVAGFLLATARSNPHLRAKYGQTALHFAAAAGCADLVTRLIQDFHLHPLEPDQSGRTAAHYAASAMRPTWWHCARHWRMEATPAHLKTLRTLFQFHSLHDYNSVIPPCRDSQTLVASAIAGKHLPILREVVESLGVDRCLEMTPLPVFMNLGVETCDADILRYLLEAFAPRLKGHGSLWSNNLIKNIWSLPNLHLVAMLKGRDRYKRMGRAITETDKKLILAARTDLRFLRLLLEESDFPLDGDLDLLIQVKDAAVDDDDFEFRQWLVTRYRSAGGPLDGPTHLLKHGQR